jgi:hypothetical protein
MVGDQRVNYSFRKHHFARSFVHRDKSVHGCIQVIYSEA